MRRLLATLAWALLGSFGAGVAADPSAGMTVNVNCARTVTVLFWPAGHGAFRPGFPTISIPHMEVYRGDAVPSEPVGPEFLGWATSGSVRGYGVGASSGNCVAVKTPHGQITPTTTITQTTRLTCRLNADITITVDELSKSSQRLRIELPNTKVAIDATLTRNGSHLTYATRYCTPKPPP